MPTPLENELNLRSGEKISVLLVDDNLCFLNIGKMFLEENGREDIQAIFTATGGKEAIDQAQQNHPQLILLDVSMPDMNGLETALRLKKILPESHIIMLTLMETAGYSEAAFAVGADALIDKDNINTDLLPTIRQIMQLSHSTKLIPGTPHEQPSD